MRKKRGLSRENHEEGPQRYRNDLQSVLDGTIIEWLNMGSGIFCSARVLGNYAVSDGLTCKSERFLGD